VTASSVAGRERGVEARLIVPGGEQLPVRSFEEGDDVVLVPLTDVAEYAGSELEPSLLEYASQRGMVRVRGEAVVEAHSVVRFRAHGEAEIIQRREYVRVHTPQPVEINGRPVRQAQTVDLSGGGMLLSGVDDLEPGALVPFTIWIGDAGGDIAGLGRVVRCCKDGKRALMFEEISENDRQRLIRFVFALMRSARAKTRGDWF
jgi:hypothetical protein